jgi:hypothetical protein
MRAPILALLALSLAVPAATAQNTGAGGQGKETFQNLRSFTVRNDSKSVVTSVKLVSTDGGRVLFQNPNPIQPSQAAEAQVGRDQCLAEVDVTFKDGRTLRSAGLNDCHLTRVSIGDERIEVESAAVR